NRTDKMCAPVAIGSSSDYVHLRMSVKPENRSLLACAAHPNHISVSESNWMAKKPQPMGNAEFRALLDRSMEELRLKTEAHSAGWGLGTTDRWDLDQEDGRLVFTAKKMIATARPRSSAPIAPRALPSFGHGITRPCCRRSRNTPCECGSTAS